MGIAAVEIGKMKAMEERFDISPKSPFARKIYNYLILGFLNLTGMKLYSG